MADVKFVSIILAGLLLLHAACMARCAAEIARQSTLPPCHSQEPTGKDQPQLPSNPCAGTPALEGKTFTMLSLHIVAIVPESSPGPKVFLSVARGGESLLELPVSASFARNSVLRI